MAISMHVNEFLDNVMVLTAKINPQIKKEENTLECALKSNCKNFL